MVLAAVQQDGLALGLAAKELRMDKDLVVAVVRTIRRANS